ncbi:MAG: mechanosensitive ion channel domain-containing protein [Candidatus Peribacteraceae bacterium]
MQYKIAPFIGIFLCALFLPAAVAAQDATAHETTLQYLYQQYLKDTSDEYILKRIENEKDAIRGIAEEELQKLVTPPTEESELAPSEIPKALDRQKSVVTSLQERLSERRVDLDLLTAEEKRFYLNQQAQTGNAESETYRLTKTHPELLAKKTILEVRISVLEALLKQQQDRLSKLITEQRKIQFEFVILIGKYLLILFIIWLIERTIRTNILTHIRNTDKRYTVTKIFTAVVYIGAILWLLGTLFANQPSILASFAIIGAGLAIALQDVVKDVLGWLMILQSRLFLPGDRITIGGITGEVVDIGMLRTRLLEVGIPPLSVLEHTGKILTIPNAQVITLPLTNHSTTSDYVNAEMRITVTFESDWRVAKELLQTVIQEETAAFSEQEKIQQLRRTRMMYMQRQIVGPRIYTQIAADGVEFILRFSVPLGEKWLVLTKISEKILEQLEAKPQVELAYKTFRYYTGPHDQHQ